MTGEPGQEILKGKGRLKRWAIRAGVALLAVTLALGAWGGWEVYSFDSELNRESALECTCSWGRLAPVPASAKQIEIQTQGGAFTRGFRVSFSATGADIQDWLNRSPGIGDAKLDDSTPGIRKYEIKPGEGAQHADVTIDDQNHQVRIYVYWS